MKSKLSPFLICSSVLGVSAFAFRKSLLGRIGLTMMNYAKDYQRKFYPDRIILVRHGQSQANINTKLYRTIPDSQIHLTQKGKSLQSQA